MKEHDILVGRNTGFPNWVRVLLWGCVLAVAAVIFLFSAQDGASSSLLSDPLADALIQVFDPASGQQPQTGVLDFARKIVRKMAHFAEFAALGFFLRLLAGSYALRRPTRWSWLAGSIYGGLDELHQLLRSERAGMWQDALLDSCGVLAGVTAAYALLVILARLRKRREEKNVQ